MHHNLLPALCLLTAFSAGIAPGNEAAPRIIESGASTATLVELYSSEGCSSCPRAETWLGHFAGDSHLWKQVVPVAFHVDYWDGLGWPDRFARHDFTQRQREYAARLGSESVYTPELIVQGRELRGSWAVLPLHDAPAPGKLRLETRPDGSVRATFALNAGGGSASAPYTLYVAWLGMGIQIDVTRGENAGSKLQHDFVVLDLQGKAITAAVPVDFSTPHLPTSDQPAALAAWVTDRKGEIILVAGGTL